MAGKPPTAHARNSLVRCVTTTQLEPSVSNNPRDGKVKWCWAEHQRELSCGGDHPPCTVHAPRGTRRTAEGAGLSRLQDLAAFQRRPVQSANGEMMRLVELSCETSEVAEVFCPGTFVAASGFVFDTLPEVVLDLRTGWKPNELATRSSVGRHWRSDDRWL